MNAEVGTAYVSLVPSAKGFAAKMQRELSGDIARAGRNAGDDYSDEFSQEASRGLKSKGKSMFGGVAKLAAGALAGVGIGQFIGDALGEARDAVVVGSRTSNVIKSMGNAANISASQVADLAGKLSNKTAVDDEVIQSGQNMLLTFGNIRNEVGKGNDIFNQASTYMVDMAQAMGTDTKSAALQLGKALNDPAKGVTALTRSGVSFTQQQKDQIKAMQESGNMLGAQKIILGEVEKQFGGAGAAMATPAERAKVAWGNFQEDVGTALLPTVDRMLNKFSDFLPTITSFASGVASKVGPAFTTAGNAAKAVFGVIANNQTTIKVVAGAVAVLTAATYAHAASMWLAGGNLKKYLLGTKLVQAATKAWAAVQWILNAAMSANPLGLIVVGVALLIGALVLAWKKSETFRKVVTAAFNGVKAAGSKVWGWIKSAWGKVKEYLSKPVEAGVRLVQAGWSKIKTGASNLVSWVKGLPGKIRSALSNLASTLKNVFVDAWDTARTAVVNGAAKVVTAVRGLPDKIRALGGKFLDVGQAIIGKFVDGLAGAAGLVGDIAGNVWDAVRGLLNSAIGQLNNALEFTINTPGPGGLTINPPNIPTLATGGRVTGATLAVIGEGSEPETVLPDSLLRGLLERTAAAAAGGGGTQVGHLTITNWREGTGYFRLVADDVLADEAGFRRDLGAMNA